MKPFPLGLLSRNHSTLTTKLPSSVVRPLGVFRRKFVPLRAVCSVGLKDTVESSARVLQSGDGFEVVGPDTSPVSASVIPFKPIGRFANEEVIGKTRRALVHLKTSISFGVQMTRPESAAIGTARINVPPETNVRWKRPQLRCADTASLRARTMGVSTIDEHRKSHPFGVTGRDARTSPPFYFTRYKSFKWVTANPIVGIAPL